MRYVTQPSFILRLQGCGISGWQYSCICMEPLSTECPDQLLSGACVQLTGVATASFALVSLLIMTVIWRSVAAGLPAVRTGAFPVWGFSNIREPRQMLHGCAYGADLVFGFGWVKA